MTNSNKKIGNDFEQELCEQLAINGFWAHNFANRKNGQPADIIAAKKHRPYLIDAKVCSKDVFEFRRIEENQHLAMQAWADCGNYTGWFALKLEFEGGIWMVTYDDIMLAANNGVKAFAYKDIVYNVGIPFAEWVKGE